MTRRPAPDWMIMAFVVFVYGGLLAFLLLLNQSVQASSGPVRPTCNDLPKAGSVTLYPNGTANAQAAVTLAIPFCSDDISVTTGVQSHNTAGERTGHNVLSPGLLTVSIQLDEPSSDEYDVDWQAMVKTQ